MPHFPMFIDLNEEPVMIVGGGAVALRKIRKLQPFGPRITVIAPEITPEIGAAGAECEPEPYGAEMTGKTKKPELHTTGTSTGPDCVEVSRVIRTEFSAELLTNAEESPRLVIAATDDWEVNRLVADLCRARDIPVNVADDPEHSTFLFPALVRQGEFCAGISTAGASPTAAIYFKEQLQSHVPEHLDGILAWLEEKRPMIKREIPDQKKRAGFFRELFDRCMQTGAPLTEVELERMMRALTPDSEGPIKVGRVALVGAGCGKADLITVRGLRLLQRCQAVVYDDLIDPELLETVPETALRIYMGKRSGAHSAPQSEINAKLIELASQGLDVVRLKGGDPYLFGRGGEEMLALLEAGIPCQEVPGIPSAIGIPAEAGIPVTHRGASRGLHIVTAHTSDTPDGLPADFDHLAKLDGTLVFLMGLGQLAKIAERLMAGGKSGETPSAVLSGGNSKHPACVRAPLAKIVRATEEAGVESPAIILVGEVSALDFHDGSVE